MLQLRSLARHVSDASFGEFRRQLEYKTAWYGTELVVADRWFPSSKTCSGCGAIDPDLTQGALGRNQHQTSTQVCRRLEGNQEPATP
jgi:transposase